MIDMSHVSIILTQSLTQPLIKRLLNCLALLCLIISFHSYAAEAPQNTILWLVPSADSVARFRQSEPYNITTDTSNLLLNQLQGYHIKLQVRSLAKLVDLLKNDKVSFCAPNRIKTAERERHSWFSLPVGTYPGLRLYSTDKSQQIPAKLLNGQSELLSLVDLFGHFPDKVLAVSKGRSHGYHLDQQIGQINRNNLYVRATKNSLGFVIDMMSKNRIDYIIEFPGTVARMQQAAEHPISLKSIKIANNPSYMTSYLSCSKTPLTRRFLKDVNTALRQLYQSDKFYQAHIRHLDSSEIAPFKRHYQAVFR